MRDPPTTIYRKCTGRSGQVVAVENSCSASDRIRFAYMRQTAWDLKIYRTVYKCPVYYVCIYISSYILLYLYIYIYEQNQPPSSLHPQSLYSYFCSKFVMHYLVIHYLTGFLTIFIFAIWDNIFDVFHPTTFRLYQAAEDARLQKRLRDDLGGTLRAFTERDSACFAPTKEFGSEVFFTSQERQWLVLHLLNSLRASELDVSSLHGNARVFEGQSIGKICGFWLFRMWRFKIKYIILNRDELKQNIFSSNLFTSQLLLGRNSA